MAQGKHWNARGRRHWMLLESDALPEPYPTHVELKYRQSLGQAKTSKDLHNETDTNHLL